MADINNINVNGTTYNIVDDEAMRLASNPTNNNILVTNANGQAVDSGVSISGVGGSGMSMDLLWTNSSPTTAFASQTVSLDLNNYEYVYIVARATTGEAYYSSFIVKVGAAEQLLCVATTYLRKRNASVTTSGVTFDGGYNQASVNSWDGNTSSAIPYQIYGIK